VAHFLSLKQILQIFEKWAKYLDESYGVDVIYLDYRKAFDTVPHKRLLTKLQQAGFGDKVITLDQGIPERQRNESRGLIIIGVPPGARTIALHCLRQ